jgi:hypothetical protein
LGLTIKRIRSYFILPLLHQLKDDGGVTNNDNNDLFGMQFLYDQVDSTQPGASMTGWLKARRLLVTMLKTEITTLARI